MEVSPPLTLLISVDMIQAGIASLSHAKTLSIFSSHSDGYQWVPLSIFKFKKIKSHYPSSLPHTRSVLPFCCMQRGCRARKTCIYNLSLSLSLLVEIVYDGTHSHVLPDRDPDLLTDAYHKFGGAMGYLRAAKMQGDPQSQAFSTMSGRGRGCFTV